MILNNAISLHVQDFILTYIFLSLNIPRREFLVSLIILGVMCEKLPAMSGVGGPDISVSFTTPVIISIFDPSHLDGCDLVSHWSFDMDCLDD